MCYFPDSPEPTLCALLGPRALRRITGAQLWLPVLSRGHASHFSLGLGPSGGFPKSPQTAPLTPTPEHLCQRGMASLTVSWLDLAGAGAVCLWPGKGACIYVCSFPPSRLVIALLFTVAPAVCLQCQPRSSVSKQPWLFPL